MAADRDVKRGSAAAGPRFFVEGNGAALRERTTGAFLRRFPSCGHVDRTRARPNARKGAAGGRIGEKRQLTWRFAGCFGILRRAPEDFLPIRVRYNRGHGTVDTDNGRCACLGLPAFGFDFGAALRRCLGPSQRRTGFDAAQDPGGSGR